MPGKPEKKETIAVKRGIRLNINTYHVESYPVDGEGLFTFLKAWGQMVVGR